MFKDKFGLSEKCTLHLAQHISSVYFIIPIRYKIRSMIWIATTVVKTRDWNWLFMAISFVQIY